MSESVVPMSAEQLEALDFETAQVRLESVVAELEGGQIPLQRALELYQLGIALRDVCRARLAAAEGLLEQLKELPDGSLAREELA